MCISETALCNGWDDCADGSDEIPQTCTPTTDQSQSSGSGTEPTKSPYVITLVIMIAAIIAIVLGFCYYRKKFGSNEDVPNILHDSAGDPLSPKPNRVVKPILAQKNGRKDLKTDVEAVRMSALNGSSIGSSYDRSHITGILITSYRI